MNKLLSFKLLVLFLFTVSFHLQAQDKQVKADFPIYETYDEIAYIFDQKNDTTYVINFWATWCGPCVKELPYFEDLHQQYKGEKVKVILVSLDFKRQLERKLIPFVEKHQLQSQVIALTDGDYNAWIDKVDPQWSGAIPITIVYRGDQRKFHGEEFANYEELENLLKAFL
ncbi:MAG: redoxin domain-containing protein [Saprospiraceae bacterium]|nr:redoxin domain-containing protein [Saprospiraceae bacterium]